MRLTGVVVKYFYILAKFNVVIRLFLILTKITSGVSRLNEQFSSLVALDFYQYIVYNRCTKNNYRANEIGIVVKSSWQPQIRQYRKHRYSTDVDVGHLNSKNITAEDQ